MNLLILEKHELSEGEVRLEGARATHLRNVLSVEVGSRVQVGLLDGPKGQGIVRALDHRSVSLTITLEGEAPERPGVDLLLALPRPKVLKRLWAQFSSLGVGSIVLINAWKVERCYFDSHAIAPEVYRPRLIEGLSQAKDTRLPEVSIARSFKAFLEDELDARFAQSKRLVADPSYDRPIMDVARTQKRILLAIGPEGGWIPRELESLEERGFRGISLGPRILRSDTALISLLAITHEARRWGAG